MNRLVFVKKDDAFTDSEIIAETAGVKRHAIQQLIEKYADDFESFGRVAFEMRTLKTPGGLQDVKVFLFNEEQATLLLTYMKNTEKVRNFKRELVRQFYEMRKFIAERHTKAWIETRQQGKLTRRSETDTIKQLVDYARQQGSTHADMLYITYSKLAKKMAGIEKRDAATTAQLSNLDLMEHIILQIIRNGIIQGINYREIYQNCKERLSTIRELAYLEARA